MVRGRRQPVRRGAPSPQQVLDQETLAQGAEARRRGEVEERGGRHHVPVRAGVRRHGAGEHSAAPARRLRARLRLRAPRRACAAAARGTAAARAREGGDGTEDAGRLGAILFIWIGRFLKGWEE